MTHKFGSKYEAISKGLYYAGRSDLNMAENGEVKKTLEEILKNPEIKIVEGDVVQFGCVHEDCTILEFNNVKNQAVRIATTKLEDGFDLWLINPDNGIGIRT